MEMAYRGAKPLLPSVHMLGKIVFLVFYRHLAPQKGSLLQEMAEQPLCGIAIQHQMVCINLPMTITSVLKAV